MMRSSRKSSNDTPNAGAVDTLVGKQTEVLGDIRFSGGLHIDGTVKGKVSAPDSAEATPYDFIEVVFKHYMKLPEVPHALKERMQAVIDADQAKMATISGKIQKA